MNILQVLPYLYHGAGRSVSNLVIEMEKRKHKSIIVTSKYRDGEYYNQRDLEEECLANDIELIKIDNVFKRDMKNIFSASVLLKKIIEEEKIDIINAHAGVATIVSYLAKMNTEKSIPLVSTVRGIGNPKKKQWQKDMDNQIINMADKVIAISSFIKEYLVAEGVKGEKVDIIHNGIRGEVDYFTEEQFLRKYNLEDNFIIGSIGELCTRKNQENIIDALSYLREENIKLFIIGDGTKRMTLQKKVETLDLKDKVIFLGHVPHARRFLSVIDLFTLTPLSEAFGLVFAEAQMAGVPAIGSNLEGIKDIIVDSKTGFLIPPNDSKILAEKIKELIRDKGLLKKMSTYAKEYSLDNFLLDKTVEKTLNVYENILSESKLCQHIF